MSLERSVIVSAMCHHPLRRMPKTCAKICVNYPMRLIVHGRTCPARMCQANVLEFLASDHACQANVRMCQVPMCLENGRMSPALTCPTYLVNVLACQANDHVCQANGRTCQVPMSPLNAPTSPVNDHVCQVSMFLANVRMCQVLMFLPNVPTSPVPMSLPSDHACQPNGPT